MREGDRVIDPSRCWIRHVKRAAAGTTCPLRVPFDDGAELHRWRRGPQATDETGVAADRAMTRDGSVVFAALGAHNAVCPKQISDGSVELDFAVAPAVTADTVAVIARQTALGAFLIGYVTFSITSTTLRIYRRTGGTWAQLVAGSALAALTAGDHRLRLDLTGNALTLTLTRLADLTVLGTLTHTLTGADATAHGAGITGRAGWRVETNSATSAVALRAFTAAASTDNPAAWDVGGGVFVAQPLEGVNGRQGWQAAEITPTLGDDGAFTIRFPNTVGDDGTLHRDRFALLTDPLYRPGEEWIEVYREPHDCLFVGTPIAWQIDGGTLELSGADAGVLELADRAGELDAWAAPPQSVIEHYGRLTRAVVSSDLRAVTNVAALPDGWQTNVLRADGTAATGTVDVDPAGGGVRLQGVGGNQIANIGRDLDGVYADDYAVALRARHDAGQVSVFIDAPLIGAVMVTVTVNADGTGIVTGLGGSLDSSFRVQSYTVPAMLDVRVVALRRFLLVYVNGQLVIVGERAYPWTTPRTVRAQVSAGATLVVEAATVLTRQPILCRGATPGTYRTPGAPTPGGLHGYYFDLTAYSQRYTAAGVTAAAFGATDEPKTERLDATIDFANNNPPTWQPPGMPAAWFGVRWAGSIYLDLSGNGRRLRFSVLDDWARVWVGHRRSGYGWGDPIIDNTGTFATNTDVRSPDLRTVLGAGAASGWYPIVIEYVQGAGAGGLTLQESPLDSGGNPTAWTTVPASKLSPYGALVDSYRLESNREIVKQIADAFGYQVVCEPRPLESGEFPGQLVPYLRAGRDTDQVIDTIEGTQASAEGDAADALDRLLVDAAGIADPSGSGQLSAEVVIPGSADAHVFLATGYESLAEITEPALLAQRASSLVALRGSPNLQVGVRPRGTRDLADTFPLTGQLARFEWRPGDGVRLDLPELAVRDLTPRQITKVSWPIFPDGVGAPSVGFRQRPRDVRTILRKALRTTLSAQRNYQGGLTLLQGTLGASGSGGAPDTVSRLVLPDDLTDVIRVDLVIAVMTGTGWALLINGAAIGITINAPGAIDVTRFIVRDDGYRPRAYAHMTGGTGIYEIQLRALARLPGSPST